MNPSVGTSPTSNRAQPAKNATAFLLANRRRRVRALQWKALTLIIDPTTLLYLIGFFILMISFARESLLKHLNLEPLLSLDPVWTTTALILGSVWLSLWNVFQSPRYVFTYSDFLLHFMPIDLSGQIRRVILRHQLMRLLILASVLALLYIVQLWLFRLEVLTLPFALMILGALFISDFARGLVQWHLFQQKLLPKALVVLTVCLLSVVGLITTLFLSEKMVWVLLSLLTFSATVALLLWMRLDRAELDWDRILTYGENKTWNGMLVKMVTGTENTSSLVTRPWITPKHKQQARRLPYQMDQLLAHKWGRFLWREQRPVLITLVFYCLLISGMAYRSQMPFFYGISFLAVSMLLTYMLGDIFKGRLEQPILRTLPWPLKEMVQSYRNKALWVLLPLILPQMWMLSSVGLTLWEIVPLLLGETLLFIAYYERGLARRAVSVLGVFQNPVSRFLTWLLFVLLTALSIWQPLSAPFIGALFYRWVSRQYQ